MTRHKARSFVYHRAFVTARIALANFTGRYLQRELAKLTDHELLQEAKKKFEIKNTLSSPGSTSSS